MLLLGWQVTVERRREGWRWALLGLAAGIGWWSNGAIITAGIAAGLIGLRYFSVRHWRGYALVAAGFLIGSGPWWLYNLRHEWAALQFLTDGFQPPPGVDPIAPGERVIALLVLGFPALYGLRFPWEPGFSLTAGIAAGALVYLALVVDGIANGYGRLSRRGVLQYTPSNSSPQTEKDLIDAPPLSCLAGEGSGVRVACGERGRGIGVKGCLLTAGCG